MHNIHQAKQYSDLQTPDVGFLRYSDDAIAVHVDHVLNSFGNFLHMVNVTLTDEMN